MKKLTLSLLVLMIGMSASAQSTNLKKRPTLGISFLAQDFVTPELIDRTSLGDVLRQKSWNKLQNMNPGINISYFEGLSDHVDVMVRLNGTLVAYNFGGVNGRVNPDPNRDKLLLGIDANVNVKLLTDNYTIVPFLSAGVGTKMFAGTYFGAYIPTGVGLQVRLGDEAFLFTQFTNNIKVTDWTRNNFVSSIGFASPIGNRKPEPKVVTPPPPPPPMKEEPKDTDGDGITDDKDKCPTVKGTAKYNGCPIPDTDGDGINDEQDKCPNVKGLAKYNGCPIPDTDQDGINDEEDKCPTVAGLARYNGCPIPDTDGDGVNDEEDKCPTEKGDPSNAGCPKLADLNFNNKSVTFLTGSAVLSKPATAELDKLYAILNERPNVAINIEGHTDNTGRPETNTALSQKRADAVKAYLVKKGISEDRMTATGFGPSKPVADNKTAAGRAENRRVEFSLR